MTQENWKAIIDYEGLYEVSDLGNVRSLDRVISKSDGVKMPLKGRVLAPTNNKNGYPCAALSRNGKLNFRKVHQLMAESFLNHKRNGQVIVVDHINNIKEDNRLENLQLITQSDNASKDKGRGKYKGVTWCSAYNKWKAVTGKNNDRKFLGYFDTEEEAHKSQLL